MCVRQQVQPARDSSWCSWLPRDVQAAGEWVARPLQRNIRSLGQPMHACQGLTLSTRSGMTLHGLGDNSVAGGAPCEPSFPTPQHDAGRSVRSCARRGAQVRCRPCRQRAPPLRPAWRPVSPRNAQMHAQQCCKGPSRGAFAPQTRQHRPCTSLRPCHPTLSSAACGPRAPLAPSARRCARQWLPPRRRRRRPRRRPRRPSSSSPGGRSAASSAVRLQLEALFRDL